MRISFEDEFIDMGNGLSNHSDESTDELEVITSTSKIQTQKYSFIVYVLPVLDDIDKRRIKLNFFELESELCRTNRVILNRNNIVILASLDATEVFVIKNEIEYKKLLKIAKETNNSIKFWIEDLPYENSKLLNVQKKFNDLFLKHQNDLELENNSPIPFISTATTQPAEIKTSPVNLIGLSKTNDDTQKKSGLLNFKDSMFPNLIPTIISRTAADMSKLSISSSNPNIDQVKSTSAKGTDLLVQCPLSDFGNSNTNAINSHANLINSARIYPDIRQDYLQLANSKPINLFSESNFKTSPAISSTKLQSYDRAKLTNTDNQDSSISCVSTITKAFDKQTKPSVDIPKFYDKLLVQTSVLNRKLTKLNGKINEMENSLVKKSIESSDKCESADSQISESISETKDTKSSRKSDEEMKMGNVAPASLKHPDIFCDHCDKDIVGIRWKCILCDDYDLCQTCEQIDNVHPADHHFIKIKTPFSFTKVSDSVLSDHLTAIARYNVKKIVQLLPQLDSRISDVAKKRKRKSRGQTYNQGKNDRKMEKSKHHQQLSIAIDKKLELSEEEKTFNRIKEIHDNLLIEIEPSIKQRTVYYIESLRQLSKNLMKKTNRKTDAEDKMTETFDKRSKTSMPLIEIGKKPLAPYLLMDTADHKSEKIDFTVATANLSDHFSSYHPFSAESLTKRMPSTKLRTTQELKSNKKLTSEGSQFFNFKNFDQMTENWNCSYEPTKEYQKLQKNLKDIMTVSPYFQKSFLVRYYEFLDQIYKLIPTNNQGKIIQNFKSKFLQLIDERSKKDPAFYSVISDKIQCRRLVEKISNEAFVLANKQSLAINSPNVSDTFKPKDDLPLNDSPLLKPGVLDSTVRQYLNKDEFQTCEKINSLKTLKTCEEVMKEVCVSDLGISGDRLSNNTDNNEAMPQEKLAKSQERTIQQDEHLQVIEAQKSLEMKQPTEAQENEEEAKSSQTDETIEKIEKQVEEKSTNSQTDKKKFEQVADKQQDDEVEKDMLKGGKQEEVIPQPCCDLMNYSDAESGLSSESKKVDSISIEEVFKSQQVPQGQNPDIFFNISLDRSDGSQSSACSLDSYEMIMSDSFDFDSNKVEDSVSVKTVLNKLLKEVENGNQSLSAINSSVTMPSVSDTQDMINSQLMCSSKSTIYKSLMEKSIADQQYDNKCPAVQQFEGQFSALSQSATSSISEKKSETKIGQKSDIFDFNNWTYLLKANGSHNLPSKDPKTLMDEFYDICRDEYGLK